MTTDFGAYLGPLPSPVPTDNGISAIITPDLTGIATGIALLAISCLLAAAGSWWRKHASLGVRLRGFSTAAPATGTPR